MRALELFAGIGGMHAACPWLEIVAAVDINVDSRAVYESNFSNCYVIRELESIPYGWLASQRADLWWMSPPCTPFTRRGHQRGLGDPRSKSLIHLIHAVESVQPEIVVLENVVGFEVSGAFDLLSEKWSEAGYRIHHRTICPTDVGWPNRRPRVYVLATRSKWPCLDDSLWSTPFKGINETNHPRLQQLLCNDWCSHTLQTLTLDPIIADKYGPALDIVDPRLPDAVAACFGSSYGRVVTRAGSYIRSGLGLRRFAPREVANVLGFPETFRLPEQLSMQRLWHLLGNSLSLPVVSPLLEFTRS